MSGIVKRTIQTTNTWTRKRDRPESGGALAVTACNGLVYAIGGSTYSLQPLSTVYAYDPQTDTWTEKADMPTARFGLQAYLVDGKIYAIGGTQSANGALATVEVYDPVTDTWESKPDMPDRLAWLGGAVVSKKIYVIGGSSDGISAVSTLWEYDPAFHTDIAAGNVSGTLDISRLTLPYQWGNNHPERLNTDHTAGSGRCVPGSLQIQCPGEAPGGWDTRGFNTIQGGGYTHWLA